MEEEAAKALVEGSKKLGVGLGAKQQYLFRHYLNNLKFFNKKLNLTRITDDYGIVVKHFLDSVSVIKSTRIKPAARVIDIGAGAGFPGIPLKIVEPKIFLYLLESSRKKALFLETVTKKLDLAGVSIVNERAEIFGQGAGREKFDVAVARAVSSLATLFEYAVPTLKIGGYFIAQKGRVSQPELSQAKEATKFLNCEIEEVSRVEVPFEEAERNLVIVRKKGKTSPKYPRRPGIPVKKPLGK